MNFFDLHCDTPYECYKRQLCFNNSPLAVSAEKGKVFDIWHQCFAVWIKDGTADAFSLYRNIISDFKCKLKSAPANLTPLFTVEGGSVLEGSIERITQLKSDGIRALTLTWNGENEIASGAEAIGGLKPFGKSVIKELNRSRIATDLSHLNRESFYDAIEYAEYPMATHSCCDTVFQHRRNLTDEQIKILASRGGIIGICLYPAFLGKGDVFQNIYKHIYHLLDMGFENNIAIGSDFDGAKMDCRLCDISKIPLLRDNLKRFGIKDDSLQKIFFKNANNFFAKL